MKSRSFEEVEKGAREECVVFVHWLMWEDEAVHLFEKYECGAPCKCPIEKCQHVDYKLKKGLVR